MLTLGTPLARESMLPGNSWKLEIAVNGYAMDTGFALATQAAKGRGFQILREPFIGKLSQGFARIKVRLLEDGYECWFDIKDVLGKAICRSPWNPQFLTSHEIQKRLPAVIDWVEKAAHRQNKYLWGGTLGPDFDCSGLVQAAFASESIWLPRDAYQQEKFSTSLEIFSGTQPPLIAGDLLFFGSNEHCSHVAIYKGSGLYWHSSGLENGRNGIGCDGIDSSDQNQIASYYREHLRGAGRIERCHDGLPVI